MGTLVINSKAQQVSLPPTEAVIKNPHHDVILFFLTRLHYVAHAGLEHLIRRILSPLPPTCWDEMCAPTCLAHILIVLYCLNSLLKQCSPGWPQTLYVAEDAFDS